MNFRSTLFLTCMVFVFPISSLCFASEKIQWDKAAHMQNFLASNYSSTLWNPAHFPFTEKHQIVIVLADSAGLPTESLFGFAIRFRDSAFGFNTTLFPIYSNDRMHTFFLAHRLMKNVSLGLLWKSARSSGSARTSKSNWDMGIAWQRRHRLLLEASFLDVKDSTSQNFYLRDGNKLSHADFKASLLYAVPYKQITFYGVLDDYQGKENQRAFSKQAYGIEAWWKNVLALRFTESSNFSSKGATLQIGSFQFAWDSFKEKFDNLSIMVLFGGR